jgi:phosphoribosyl 1,2-cyclic phosphodiesterase
VSSTQVDGETLSREDERARMSWKVMKRCSAKNRARIIYYTHLSQRLMKSKKKGEIPVLAV